jgi:hypothetical protein
MKPESEKSNPPGFQVSAKGNLRTSISLILSNMALDVGISIIAFPENKTASMSE